MKRAAGISEVYFSDDINLKSLDRVNSHDIDRVKSHGRTMTEFSPIDIAKLTGISADILRDWRRRGFLNAVGTLDKNGRWTYNVGELIQFAIVSEIKAFGLDIEFAFEVASKSIQVVYAWLQVNEGSFETEQRKVRFISILKFGDELEVKQFAELTDILQFSSSAYFVVDALKVAKNISLNHPQIPQILAKEFGNGGN